MHQHGSHPGHVTKTNFFDRYFSSGELKIILQVLNTFCIIHQNLYYFSAIKIQLYILANYCHIHVVQTFFYLWSVMIVFAKYMEIN